MKYFQPTVENKRQCGEDLCTGKPLLSNLAIFIVALDFRILDITDTSEVPSFLANLFSHFSPQRRYVLNSVFISSFCLLLLIQIYV